MASLDLLELDLRSPLAYRGLENPPLAGLPGEGSVSLPSPDGTFRSFALGSGLSEGEEELFALEAEELVAFDPDEGPRLADPLPALRFYGRSAGGSACGGCSACGPAALGGDRGDSQPAPVQPPCGDAERSLPAGRYLFLQFRPADRAELASGLEWFAREAWWQGKRCSGPYFVRRVKEDGKLATQILRREEA
jgi:hypothetical protein